MQRARKRRNYRLRRSRRMAASAAHLKAMRKFVRITFARGLGRRPLVMEVGRATWRDIGSLAGVIAFQFFTAGSGGQNPEENTSINYIGAEVFSFEAAARKFVRDPDFCSVRWEDLIINVETDRVVRLEDGSWAVAAPSDIHYDRHGNGLRLRRNFGDGLDETVAKPTEAPASV